MPFVDYELRLSSRFVCPTPQSASPAQKGAHQLGAVYNVKTPHVAVSTTIGTRAPMVDRTDANFYEGHVPDSPVLLGVSQSASYARAIRGTGWSPQWFVAMGAGMLAGAAIGAVAVTGMLGVFAIANYFGLAWGVAVTLGDFVFGACLWGVGIGLMSMLSDWRDWSQARARFNVLADMSDVVNQFSAGIRRDIEERKSADLIVNYRDSTDWVLQQASLELEAAREKAGYPVAEAAA